MIYIFSQPPNVTCFPIHPIVILLLEMTES